MRYKRSSFIKWLKEKCDVEIQPLPDTRGVKLVNGPVHSYMFVNRHDCIEYKEIYVHCQKLYLVDLPGDKDLERHE